jgi:hypothetical protein
MPQFDKILFFNQVFWLTFLFFSFYFILVSRYLPLTISTFKIRKKKLIKNKFFLSLLKKKNSSLFNQLTAVSITILNSFIVKD